MNTNTDLPARSRDLAVASRGNQFWIRLGIMLSLLLGATRLAPAQSQVNDSIVQDATTDHHTTTANVKDLHAAYQVNAAAFPVVNHRLIFRNVDARVPSEIVLNVDGRPDFTSMDTILSSILTPGMTDEQKAIAIWKLVVAWRYHWAPPEEGNDPHDPVKLFNVYGYGFCDDGAQVVVALSTRAGMPARVYGLTGHVVPEIFFANAWHMLDPDHQNFLRALDGHILSVDEITSDPLLVTGILGLDPVGVSYLDYGFLFTSGKNWIEPTAPVQNHIDNPLLLPLDEVTFDLAPGSLLFSVLYPDKIPPSFGNGVLARALSFETAGNTALIPVSWPYVIVGGTLNLTLAQGQSVSISCSTDGTNFEPLAVTLSGQTLTTSLTSFFQSKLDPYYSFTLKVQSLSPAPLSSAILSGKLNAIFQFAPKVLQKVHSGTTTFTVDVSPSIPPPQDWEGVLVIHEWEQKGGSPGQEQTATQPGVNPTDIIGGQATVRAGSIDFAIQTLSTPLQGFKLFLNTDGNHATGYSRALDGPLTVNFGADFLVEGYPKGGAAVYRFAGQDQSLFTWQQIGSIPFTPSDTNVVLITVPTAGMNLIPGGTVEVALRTVANGVNLDSLSRSPEVWVLNVPDNGSVPPPPPSPPAIVSISTDTGISSNDQVTSDSTLIFQGTADSASVVTVTRAGLGAVGTVTADASGRWLFDYTTTPLPDGSYVFSATARNASSGATSLPSADFPVLVDSTVPHNPLILEAITDSGALANGQLTSDRTLVLEGIADPGVSVSVVRTGFGQIGITTADSSGNWSLDYTGTTLPDGAYAFSATAMDNAGNISPPSLDFRVTIQTPQAPGESVNVIFPANGGLLESFTSEYNSTDWAADNLTDGVKDGQGNSWASRYLPSAPQEFVYSFSQHRTADLQEAMIYNYSVSQGAYASSAVSFFASNDGVNWQFITQGNLVKASGPQTFNLYGISTRYIKLIVSNGFSPVYWEMGELEIYGTLQLDNLLLPANGGRLESFTSQYDPKVWAAANLTDGVKDGSGNSWASHYLPSVPQEFIYSFWQLRTAQLEQAMIYNYSVAQGVYSSSSVSFYASNDRANWRFITSGNLDRLGGPQTFDLKGVTATYIKLVVSSGFSPIYWEMGEFEVYGTLF